jgi:hypothetical protein
VLQPLVFHDEVVRVSLLEGRIRVVGVYSFRNPNASAVRQPMFYPFPVDSLHVYPDRVEVTDTSFNVGPIPFVVRASGISFEVDAPAKGTATVEVVYEQECPRNEACYILTTTAAWDRPLAHAAFEITLTEDAELLWSAYDVGEAQVIDGKPTYVFEHTDFMPTKDLCLKWRVR